MTDMTDMTETDGERSAHGPHGPHGPHMRFIQSRLPTELYEWLRLRGFLLRRSMNSIVLDAIGEYRAAVEAGELTPSKEGIARVETVKYNVRVDEDLYEWLRATSFYARLSINAIFVSALARYHAAHRDTDVLPASDQPTVDADELPDELPAAGDEPTGAGDEPTGAGDEPTGAGDERPAVSGQLTPDA